MKKAWELSVLCAADVSILIFSATGKPFEFSSRDLDSEVDRYLEVSRGDPRTCTRLRPLLRGRL